GRREAERGLRRLGRELADPRRDVQLWCAACEQRRHLALRPSAGLGGQLVEVLGSQMVLQEYEDREVDLPALDERHERRELPHEARRGDAAIRFAVAHPE